MDNTEKSVLKFYLSLFIYSVGLSKGDEATDQLILHVHLADGMLFEFDRI